MLLPLLVFAGAASLQLPTPSERQMAWHQLDYYGFVHFGPNTFTGEEWGHGNEDPKLFNPKKLDCRQWVRSFKRAGMQGVIITAKHHDGFCLWPSAYSTHTVAKSPWRGGKGDVLRELADACKEEGMKLGVYLSPWDRNHPTYGTADYNDTFVRMLREVLTNYGPIFEVWFDGANGEGPNGKRQVYDWDRYIRTVRECQPNAVIFSDAGPDLRWVGNENGYAGETNWSPLRRNDFFPGTPKYKQLTEGHEDGTHWVPSECDVSIRPGWFWRKSEDEKVKSVQSLLDIWYGSVGRGSTLLLNVPPNSDGRISDVDVDRLLEFKKAREAEFDQKIKVKSVEGGTHPKRLIDGNTATFAEGTKFTFDFGKEAEFDRVRMDEAIQFGQRIGAFEVRVEVAGKMQTIASGTTVNRTRLLRVPSQKTRRVEIEFMKAKDTPRLSNAEFFKSRPNR